MTNWLIGLVVMILFLAVLLGVGALILAAFVWISANAAWVFYVILFLMIFHVLTYPDGGLPAVFRMPSRIGKDVRESFKEWRSK